MSVAAPIDEVDAGDLSRARSPRAWRCGRAQLRVRAFGGDLLMRMDGLAPLSQGSGGAGRVGALDAREVRHRCPVGDPAELPGHLSLNQRPESRCSSEGSTLPPDRIITVRPGGVAPFR